MTVTPWVRIAEVCDVQSIFRLLDVDQRSCLLFPRLSAAYRLSSHRAARSMLHDSQLVLLAIVRSTRHPHHHTATAAYRLALHVAADESHVRLRPHQPSERTRSRPHRYAARATYHGFASRFRGVRGICQRARGRSGRSRVAVVSPV